MIRIDRKKQIQSGILIVVILLVLVPPFYRPVFESPPFRQADEAGIAYVDEAFDRALVAFALARATNAIISVIQDSEIDIAPAGIGVTIAIGEALDPINDMIERFSWVMLVSLVSLGMQKLLIEISPWVSIKLILLPALVLLLAGILARKGWAQKCTYYGVRLLFLALLIRFCVPTMALVNNQVYGLFLDRHYAEAVVGIEQGNAALRNMDPLKDDLQTDEPEGVWAGIKKKAEKVGEVVDLQNRITRMKNRMSGMVENLLKVIAVFILSTVILPIGFLWLMVRLFRTVAGHDVLFRVEQLLVAKIAGGGDISVSETVHPAGDGDDAEIDEQDEDVKTDQ